MNLLHLQYFYEVAKSGNISLAAKRLRVSQPAVSKMVKNLEESLGVKLFERNRKGIILTSAGKIAIESAIQIFSQAQNLETRLTETGGTLQGDLNLGISDNLAIHIFPEILGRFKNDHSKVSIGIFVGTSSLIKEELRFGRCEAGVFYSPVQTQENLHSEQIGRAEFLVVISKKSPWAKMAKLNLENLKRSKVPKIGSRQVDFIGGTLPAHFHMHQLGLTEPSSIEANQHEVQKQLTLMGHGYSLQLRHAITQELKSGQLLEIKTPQPLWSPIYWVTPKGRPLSAPAREFYRTLKTSKFFGGQT